MRQGRPAAGSLHLRWGLIQPQTAAEAGAELADARAAFARLGALPWVERTRTLLIGTGSTVEEVAAPVPLPTVHAAVIECVRSGLSIPETARRLLLTERTVAHRLQFGKRPATTVARGS